MINKFLGSSFWKSSPNTPHPKFFHIISSSDELCRLSIPVVFAKRYCKNMLNPVFLEAPHGKAWEIEVEYSQGQIWLAKGWKEFSNYYSISINHVLLFTYNPRAHFDVTIIDQSAAEIEYPIDQDMELHDIPVNLQTNANVIDQEKSQDQEVGEANSSSRYSLVNLNGDNPYYEIVIKKTHTTRMTIPMRFAKKTDIINMKNMMLINGEGREWGAEIEYNGKMVIIKRGWAEFRKHNKIVNGETCRFKLIQGHVVDALLVQKIPTPHSLQ